MTLEVDGTNTIKSIKEKIQEKQGILVSDQGLICFGKRLDDHRTLDHHYKGFCKGFSGPKEIKKIKKIKKT